MRCTRQTGRGVLVAVGTLLSAGRRTDAGPGSSDDTTTVDTDTNANTNTTANATGTAGGSGSDRTSRTPEPTVTSGKTLGRTRAFDAPITLGPATAGDTLHVGTETGVLYALAPDGIEQ